MSLEIGSSPANARGVNLEDSWKGEILPDFLFLGDRVTASDMDRLTTLEVTHVLNATEDACHPVERALLLPHGPSSPPEDGAAPAPWGHLKAWGSPAHPGSPPPRLRALAVA